MNNKRLLLIGGALLAIVGVVAILTIFQPQKLFIDDVVEEARPQAVSVPVAEMMTPKDPFADDSPSSTTLPPVVPEALKGAFISLEHTTTGIAEVIPVASGNRILRLDDFATDNGPDLFVYLVSVPADGSQSFDADYVDLGRLKGNVGGQNYEIPAEVDLNKYQTVVIWCKRFTTAFGAAEMTVQGV